MNEEANKEIVGTTTEVQSVAEVSQDDKNMGLLLWIGTLFFGFIPGLVFYLTQKENPYVLQQSKEALNWSITTFIGYAASMVLALILVGFLLMFVIGICHLIFCILGAVATSKGEKFKVPFTLRLIK